jgi:hypothetical protein
MKKKEEVGATDLQDGIVFHEVSEIARQWFLSVPPNVKIVLK